MKCSRCGAELLDNAMFCCNCGAKIEKKKLFCRECGARLKDNAKFCEECGARVDFINQEAPIDNNYNDKTDNMNQSENNAYDTLSGEYRSSIKGEYHEQPNANYNNRSGVDKLLDYGAAVYNKANNEKLTNGIDKIKETAKTGWNEISGSYSATVKKSNNNLSLKAIVFLSCFAVVLILFVLLLSQCGSNSDKNDSKPKQVVENVSETDKDSETDVKQPETESEKEDKSKKEKNTEDKQTEEKKDTEPETEKEKKPETEPVLENLTVENCPELAAMLSNPADLDASYGEFANKYKGRTIEFDGRIDNCAKHGNYDTRFDYLVSAGDFDPNSMIGPYFQFENVGYYDLHTDLDTVSVGLNVHIIATVESYNASNGLFKLKPVSVTGR